MSALEGETPEDRAFVAQERWIRKRYGRRVAEMANYGWFVDEIENTYGTKVYGYGILVTDMTTLEHEFESRR